MKRYSRASDDVFRHIEQVRADWYSPYLDDVDQHSPSSNEHTCPMHGPFVGQPGCPFCNPNKTVPELNRMTHEHLTSNSAVYEVQEGMDRDLNKQFRVTDTRTDSRVATCYVQSNADLVCAALNAYKHVTAQPPTSAQSSGHEPYWTRSFWSPCREYLLSVHSYGEREIVAIDDNGDEWEATGPAQDIAGDAVSLLRQSSTKDAGECGACDKPGEHCANVHGICSRHGGRAHEPSAGVKCTHCNGKGYNEPIYDEQDGWIDETPCGTCNGSGRITTVEQYLKTLPANWHEDSSLETWFPITAEELKRLKDERASQPPSGWRPIETAPKDGTLILTVVAGWQPGIFRWDEIGRWTPDPESFLNASDLGDWIDGNEYNPTHWMPLPAGPAVTKESSLGDEHACGECGHIECRSAHETGEAPKSGYPGWRDAIRKLTDQS